MKAIFRKAHAAIYGLLNEEGKQSILHDKAEHVISAMICLNVVLIVCERMEWSDTYHGAIRVLQLAFFTFFLLEYILRIWIADWVMHDRRHPVKSRVRYMLSFRAMINLLALLPVGFFGIIIDFRIFRVLRLLRISWIKSLRRYTDMLVKVLRQKGPLLVVSLVIVFTFMLTSAVIVYDLEHKAQPDVFSNVLSSLWWSMAAVTTIGYGDMYPITSMGKVFASLLSIFGVFLMAIPIGILTSGFFAVSEHANPRHKRECKRKPPPAASADGCRKEHRVRRIVFPVPVRIRHCGHGGKR